MDMYYFESLLYQQGYRLIAGVDEAGRGSLAGPVVAAAVILPKNRDIHGLKESKKLTETQRERFFSDIERIAVATGIGVISSEEIDRINILQATLKAMAKAISNLSMKPDYVLIDGLHAPSLSIPFKAIPKGDTLSLSIAAASVLAKVTRDRMMCGFHKIYPQYGFEQHKGYGTPQHFAAIAQFGVCKIHRKSFKLI